jgi:uncharacterized protein
MLTRAQIQRLAQRHGIGAQVQERDYIQHMLLYLAYTHTQEFIFKGGTALRIVYRGNRYSEDLDFNGPAQIEFIKGAWERVTHGLQDFGIVSENRDDWTSEHGYSFDVSYQGPLYDGRERSKGKIRIDISRRQEVVETRRELVSPEYDDLWPFVLTVLTPEHLIAEKMRAFLARGKPRDVYDLWLLSKQGVKLDKNIVAAKLAVYEDKSTLLEPQEALAKARQDWERDLRPLLGQFVAWEVVEGEIGKIIE